MAISLLQRTPRPRTLANPIRKDPKGLSSVALKMRESIFLDFFLYYLSLSALYFFLYLFVYSLFSLFLHFAL